MAPRQNGKNADIEAFEFYLLSTDPNTHILHTAHQVKTSKRAFNRLANIFSDKRHPEICAMVKTIRRTNGEEAIILNSGASIEYSARSRSAARGFDAITLVVYDEAQELTDEQVEALMATLSASPTGDRQLIYAGTPPPPGSPGEVFGRTREKALTDPSKHMSWHEWSIEKKPADDVAFDDLIDDIYATNPAMGTRLSLDFTEEEFGSMSADGFARERLGWWATGGSFNAAINAIDWDACATGNPPQGGKVSFAVKFDIDGKNAAIAVSAKEPNGLPHVELIECRMMPESLAYIADFLAERADTSACFVIDGKAYSGALCNELTGKGITKKMIVLPSPQDVCTAAQMLVTKITDHSITHYSQPDFNEYAKGCSKRVIGSSGGWGIGDGTAPGYPVEAASLALWGNETTKRDPNGGISVW